MSFLLAFLHYDYDINEEIEYQNRVKGESTFLKGEQKILTTHSPFKRLNTFTLKKRRIDLLIFIFRSFFPFNLHLSGE